MLITFQSPSHRGGGASELDFKAPEIDVEIRDVSIPFSSGRRRLRSACFPFWPQQIKFQSPSHRGGGASGSASMIRNLAGQCFNPLLIGAEAPPVRNDLYFRQPIRKFQSPSHRGGGASQELKGINPPDKPQYVSIPFSSGRRRLRTH